MLHTLRPTVTIAAMDYIEILRKVPLFAHTSERFLRGLARSCQVRSFSSGAYLVEQGESGVGLFIITSGKVRVEKKGASGKPLVIAEHGPGDVIGEMSVIDGAPRSASVLALEETETLALASWSFNAFMESHPELALEILPVVVRRFRETNDKLIEMMNSCG
ncbi:MAG: Crp/Fnr family transcriptional regulator [Spirochaetaceae bacterium]